MRWKFGGWRPLGLKSSHCFGQCLQGALNVGELSSELIVGRGGCCRGLGRYTQDELESWVGVTLYEGGPQGL